VLPVKTWSPRRTVGVPVRQTSNAPAAAWTRVLFSGFHTLQSSAAVHWSARTIQRSAKVTRPCMEPVGLHPAHYIQAAAYRTISRYRDMKCHDISISLLGYDMITSRKLKPIWILMKHHKVWWQWHQRDHIQIICTSLHTDNHASTSSIFYRLDAPPDAKPTVSKDLRQCLYSRQS